MEEIDQLADDSDIGAPWSWRPRMVDHDPAHEPVPSQTQAQAQIRTQGLTPPPPPPRARSREPSAPPDLIAAFQKMSVSAITLHNVGRIPFLLRNHRWAFEARARRASGNIVGVREKRVAYGVQDMIKEENNIQTR